MLTNQTESQGSMHTERDHLRLEPEIMKATDEPLKIELTSDVSDQRGLPSCRAPQTPAGREQ